MEVEIQNISPGVLLLGKGPLDAPPAYSTIISENHVVDEIMDAFSNIDLHDEQNQHAAVSIQNQPSVVHKVISTAEAGRFSSVYSHVDYCRLSAEFLHFQEQGPRTVPSSICMIARTITSTIGSTSITYPPFASSPSTTVACTQRKYNVPVNDRLPAIGMASDSMPMAIPWSTQHPHKIPQVVSTSTMLTSSAISTMLEVPGSSSRKDKVRKKRLPRCNVCWLSYGHVVHELKLDMLATKCGHLLCRACATLMIFDNRRDCPVCDMTNMISKSNMRELYLSPSSLTNRKVIWKKQTRKGCILRCNVCQLSYGHVVHRLKFAMLATKCGHILCRLCVTLMTRDSRRECPVCKKRSMIINSKLWELFL